MKRGEQRIDEILERGFTRFDQPSDEQLAADLARLRERLDPTVTRTSLRASMQPQRARQIRRWLLPAAAAVILATLVVTRPWSTDSLATIAEGSLHSGSDQPLRQGDAIGAGQVVRSNGGPGSVVELSDGSRVEMRSQSELSLERTDDGMRIRLNRGGIIVNAAKQRTGHLYVRTKDMTVSVVGTVFLVSADDIGSRVAVIEGEVRVQQGATEKTLLTGEQLATNSAMASPVPEAIAWSRNAAALTALLRQLSAAPLRLSLQVTPSARETFEEVSIRPSTALAAGGRGDGAARPFVIRYGSSLGCSQGRAQVDPRRFAYFGVTLYTLIVHAYGNTKTLDLGGCVDASRVAPIVGGPDWIRSEQWDIQATMRPGSPADIEGVRLKMQAMLTDRFKLQMRRGTRDVQAFVLTMPGGQLRDATSPGSTWLAGRDLLTSFLQFVPADYHGVGNNMADGSPYLFFGKDASIADLVNVLVRLGGRPVFDRTGLGGQFNFAFTYPTVPGPDGETGGLLIPLNDATWLSFRSEFERQLGFRLEDARTAVDGHTIVNVERPSEN